MDPIKIFNEFASSANLSVLETTVYLILFALLIWLSKEFKTQYHKDQDMRSVKIEKALTSLSKILAVGHQYKNDQTKEEELFVLIYESIPIMDHYLYEDIMIILDDDSLNKSEKISSIIEKVSAEIKILVLDNQSLSSKRPIDTFEKAIIKLKDIFYPVIASFSTLFIILLFILVSLSESNEFLQIIKPIALSFILFFPFFIWQLFLQKNLNKTSCIYIFFILFSLISILIISNIWLVLLVLGFTVVLMFLLIKYGSSNSIISS